MHTARIIEMPLIAVNTQLVPNCSLMCPNKIAEK